VADGFRIPSQTVFAAEGFRNPSQTLFAAEGFRNPSISNAECG